MFCQHCGTQQPDTARFCSKCGSNLDKAAKVEQVPISASVPDLSKPESAPIPRPDDATAGERTTATLDASVTDLLGNGPPWVKAVIGTLIVVVIGGVFTAVFDPMALVPLVRFFGLETEVPSRSDATVAGDKSSESVASRSRDESPDAKLSALVRSNAKLMGYSGSDSKPKIVMSFSNGYLEYKFPDSVDAVASGPASSFTGPDRTCVGFEIEDRIGAIADPENRNWKNRLPIEQLLVCIAVREINVQNLDGEFQAEKGDLFLYKKSDVDPLPSYFRVNVDAPIANQEKQVAATEPDTSAPEKQAELAGSVISLVGKYPDEMFFGTQQGKRLAALLGPDREMFTRALAVTDANGIVDAGAVVLGMGCEPHSCGTTEAAFAIDKDSGMVWAIMMADGGVKVWGVSSMMELPAPLKEWARKRNIAMVP